MIRSRQLANGRGLLAGGCGAKRFRRRTSYGHSFVLEIMITHDALLRREGAEAESWIRKHHDAREFPERCEVIYRKIRTLQNVEHEEVRLTGESPVLAGRMCGR